MFRNVLQGGNRVRTVGVEDGGFPSSKPPGLRFGKALLVGVLMEDLWVEDLVVSKITIDSLDATDRLVGMLANLCFDVIMLGGISFGGFNLVDPRVVVEKFGTPVIIISRTQPNNIAMKKALIHHFKDWEKRWNIIKDLGRTYSIFSMLGEPPIYVEVVGGDLRMAKKMVCELSVCCRVPEPVRVARLIARGLTRKF